MTERAQPVPRSRKRVVVIAVAVTALVTLGLTALLVNILERQTEGRHTFAEVVEIGELETDPSVWGRNFPVQYEAYMRTEEAVEHEDVQEHDIPEGVDPQEWIAQSRVQEDPRLVVMWDGYPFAEDYRHARGHYYMLDDQRATLRVANYDQPGACLNCHASTVELWDDLGEGDQRAGFDTMNAMHYDDATELVDHPITCIDCHDPDTMALRITRPAFMDGIAALKASEGVEDYDVNRDATRQEMRSYVCAQCHVEYYFAGEGKTLTFPWSKGLHIEDIVDHLDEVGHVDFVHARTGGEMIKAQHPEFDIWSQGIHAQAGVSCADCHMSYTREGAQKVTNHQIQSPREDLNASCGVCHTGDVEALTARIDTIQDRFRHSRDAAFDAMVQLVEDIEAALEDGTPQEYVDNARHYHRLASFYIDYVYSENSYGFHADQYSQQILADATDFVRKGQLALRGESMERLERDEQQRLLEEAEAAG